MTKKSKIFSRVGLALSLAGATALLGALPASAAPGGVGQVVTPSQLNTSEPSPGESGWISQTNAGASIKIGGVAGLGSVATLDHADMSSIATLAYAWGIGARPSESGPTTLETLLENASYHYTGDNVNFQFGIHFAPKSMVKYGPHGTDQRCGANSAEQRQDPRNVCWATIKFETGQVSEPGEWLSFEPMEYSNQGYGQEPGWWPTKNIGPYGTDPSRRAGINQLLEQIDSYEIWQMGVSVGSGTVGTSYVSDLSFGGADYRFQPEPAPKAPPADTEALLERLGDDAYDAEVLDPDLVSVSAEDLSRVTSNEDLVVSIPWDGADGLVDVYLMSSPTYVGTVPVTSTGLDVNVSASLLSQLSGTDHHLVFIGQESGSIRALPFAIAATPNGGADESSDGPVEREVARGEQIAETGNALGYGALVAGAGVLLAAGLATHAMARRRLTQ